MLAKKVDLLNKAMEVEAKKMRREVAAMEKEVSAIRSGGEHDQRARRLAAPRATTATMTRSLSARYAPLKKSNQTLALCFGAMENEKESSTLRIICVENKSSRVR